MDFLAVIGFLVLYYLRPQEWIAPFASLRPVLVVFVFGIAAMVFRDRGFSPKEFFRTPHDYVMLGFLLWIALATGSNDGNWRDLSGLVKGTLVTLWGLKNFAGFYFVIVQALNTRERLEKFLWWWLGMILMVAVLALVAEVGIDPMGSYAITHGPRMQGRLILNNRLFNNPNELGHTIVPLIPLIYLLCIWKRPAAVKQAALVVMTLPLTCVYLTKSKGSYISGGAAALAAMVFGRPKAVQAMILALGLTIGVAGIMMLPRMQNMHAPRDDEGIQGRLAAFGFGYRCFKHNRLLGQQNFIEKFRREYGFPKASHCAYNQIGAELGPLGLFLYLSAFYCGLRTLFTARTCNTQEERLRRVILAGFAAFMVSGWMIDLAYNGTFFVLLACSAAFHRLMLENRLSDAEPAAETQVGGFIPSSERSFADEWSPEDFEEEEARDKGPRMAITWNRYGLVDLIACISMVLIVSRLWYFFVNEWGR